MLLTVALFAFLVIGLFVAIKRRSLAGAFLVLGTVAGVPMLLGLAGLFYVQRAAHFVPEQTQLNVHQLSPGEFISHSTSGHARWSFFAIVLVPVLIGLAVAGAVSLIKRAGDPNRRSAWPLLAAAPLLLFLFFIGSIRSSKSVSYNVRTGTEAEVAEVRLKSSGIAQMRQDFETGDIHMLMDRADAPRIVMTAESVADAGTAVNPEAPPAPEAPAPETAENSADKERQETEVVTDSMKVGDKDTNTSDEDEDEKSADDPPVENAPAEDAHVDAHVEGQDKEDDKSGAVAAALSEESEKSDAKAEQDAEISESKESEQRAAKVAKARTKSKEETAEPRPGWLKDQPKRVNDSWQEVVATDEYATTEECRRAMDIYLMYKTQERIQTLMGRPYVDTSLPSLTFDQGLIFGNGMTLFDSRNQSAYWYDPRLDELMGMGIGIDFIRREIVADQYFDEVERSFGPMHKMYTRIKFTPALDEQLRQHWAVYERRERFGVLGVGAASVLGFLGFVYGLLKVDTLTKGYYTKRLFIGVPAAIIGGMVLLVLTISFFDYIN